MDAFLESLLINAVRGALQNMHDAENGEYVDDSSSSGSESGESSDNDNDDDEGANDHDADTSSTASCPPAPRSPSPTPSINSVPGLTDGSSAASPASLSPPSPGPASPSSSTVNAEIDAIEASYEVDCGICTYFSYAYSIDYEALFAYFHGEV
ncbi:uncharacterized protein J3D65DRAFT_671989 [Phyllosticta citribraziliensis]|uniref:Uncharacterized protein n=1 Tax=Phyllosticta citribraziliensis TaxID=989973 RepID=A0ABR1L6Z0_9PEZI